MSSIRTNFLYSSVLTAANYIFPLIVYPYISRVLGVTKIGACNYVDSIVQYFVLISMFGITSIGIREIAKAKSSKEKLNDVYNNLFWANALFTSIAVCLLLIVIFTSSGLSQYKDLLMIGVVKVISNFFLIDWFFRGLEDFKYITFRTLAVKCIYVICIFIFINDEGDYKLYYLLTVLMLSVNALINQLHAKKFIKIRFRGNKLRTYIIPIIIMGVYTFMTSMYTTFNTAYLGYKAGETEVGYFSTAHTLYGALLAFFSAFTGVMLPRMSSLISEGNIDRFKSLLRKSANVLFSYSIPFVCLFVVYAPEIILLYAGSGFEGAVIPMQICMPLMIIIGYEQIIITQGLLPLDKNKAVLINSIIGAMCGVLCSILIVPQWQSVGSSIVWGISELVVLSSASYFIYKYIKFVFPLLTLVKEVLVYTPLLIILLQLHSLNFELIISLILSGTTTIVYTFIVQRFIMKQEEMVRLTDKFIKK